MGNANHIYANYSHLGGMLPRGRKKKKDKKADSSNTLVLEAQTRSTPSTDNALVRNKENAPDKGSLPVLTE